jgi:hypothetical protein
VNPLDGWWSLVHLLYAAKASLRISSVVEIPALQQDSSSDEIKAAGCVDKMVRKAFAVMVFAGNCQARFPLTTCRFRLVTNQ